jgi:hypothetical protein
MRMPRLETNWQQVLGRPLPLVAGTARRLGIASYLNGMALRAPLSWFTEDQTNQEGSTPMNLAMLSYLLCVLYHFLFHVLPRFVFYSVRH